MKDVRRKLTTGTVWLTATRALVNFIGFAGTLVLARLLTPADFGLVALAMTMFAIASAVSELSMGAALIQHQDPTPEHYDTAWTLNALRGFILAAGFA